MAFNVSAPDSDAYELHPVGDVDATCVDVVDLGENENPFSGKTQHRCALIFITAELREDGTNFEYWAFFTVSLHERANLRKKLATWRGRDFTLEELTGFDLEKLIGVNARLVVAHKEKQNGDMKAVLETILLPKKGQKTYGKDFVRHIERPIDESKDVRSQKPENVFADEEEEDVEQEEMLF